MKYLTFQLRLDTAPRDDAGRLQRDAQGLVVLEAYATRVGVFEYYNQDGSRRREARLPEHVLKKESLDSLANKPVTMLHPSEMLNAENTQKYIKGYIGDQVTVEGDLIKVKIFIFAADLIRAIESGEMTELSCGYFCDLDYKAGNFNGEDYDAIQINIFYNHLAVVPKGRAGSRVRLKLDAAASITLARFDSYDSDLFIKDPQEVIKTVIIKIDGKDIDVPDEIAPTIQAVVSKADTAQKSAAEIQKNLDAEAAAKAILEQEVAEYKKKEDAAKLNELVTEVKAIINNDSVKLDGLTPVQLKTLALKAKYPTMNLDGQKETFISNGYEFMKAQKADSKEDTAPAGKETKNDNRSDAFDKALASLTSKEPESKTDSQSAREDMLKNMSEAWQK